MPDISAPGWYSDAREFFSDPRAAIIGYVASWIVAVYFMFVSNALALFELVSDVAMIVPETFEDTLTYAFGGYYGQLQRAFLAVQDVFAAVTVAAGPFGFLVGALFVALGIYALVRVLRLVETFARDVL